MYNYLRGMTQRVMPHSLTTTGGGELGAVEEEAELDSVASLSSPLSLGRALTSACAACDRLHQEWGRSIGGGGGAAAAGAAVRNLVERWVLRASANSRG